MSTTAVTTVAAATDAAATTTPVKKVGQPRLPRTKTTNTGKGKAVDAKSISDEFAKQVMEKYALDENVMESMKNVVLVVLNKYNIFAEQQTQVVEVDDLSTPTKGKGKSKDKAVSTEPKKSRKTSPYNLYVKEMMQDSRVKPVAQKEKMAVIGNLWKALDDASKAPYLTRAAQLNAESETETATEATVN